MITRPYRYCENVEPKRQTIVAMAAMAMAGASRRPAMTRRREGIAPVRPSGETVVTGGATAGATATSLGTLVRLVMATFSEPQRLGLAEQALGSDEQHCEQHDVGDGVGPRTTEAVHRQRLDQAQEQPAQQGADDRVHAAEQDGGEGDEP